MKTLLLLACFISFVGAADEPDAPGKATPAAAAKPGEYRLVWDNDAQEGNKTSIVVGSAVGLRNLATVTSKNKDDEVLVSYPAIAYLDSHKVMHVDGRGAPLSEPHEEGYSPDSFTIAVDGKVVTLDDNENGGTGKLVSNPDGQPKL